MEHLKIMKEYLDEMREADDFPTAGLPFVTISRQAGAGGHVLSYVMTNDFMKDPNQSLFGGWHVFDKDICQLVAKDPAIQESMEQIVEDRYKNGFHTFFEELLSGSAGQYRLQKKTFEVVRMLAMLGKVVIVGRAASFVSSDLPCGVHIRLVAPLKKRIVWLMKKFTISKEEAQKLITRQDVERRKLVKTFFDKDIDDSVHYDVVWNTGTADLHSISHSVMELIRSKNASKPAPKA